MHNTSIAKIKKHIKDKGHDTNFVVTEPLIMYWWWQLNNAVFDGNLSPPKRIEIRRFRGCFGWCTGLKRNGRVVLGINSTIPTRKVLLTVLVHEMVHHWEYQTLGHMSHGYSFYGWQSKIKHRINIQLNEFI